MAAASTTPVVPANQAAVLPWNPHVPSQYTQELQKLAQANQLSGLPPQILTYIMEAESGPSYVGGGWNGQAGGWFGLEPADGTPVSLLRDPSMTSFDTQAQVSAALFVKLLGENSNNAIAAENEYQTGHPSVAANGAGIFTSYLQQAGTTLLTEGSGSFPGGTGTPSFPGESNVASALSGVDAIGAIFNDIGSGFGIGWKNVLTIIGGALLIIVGMFVLFHHQVGQAAESAVSAV
jgi:hypothetical protein